MTVYLNDTFTGTAGTVLTAHAPDTGATWVVGTTGPASMVLAGDGNVRNQKATGQVVPTYATPAALAAANVDVTLVLSVKTVLAADFVFCWVRADFTASNGYFFQVDQAGHVSVSRWVAGVATQLMTGNISAPVAGTTRTLRLSVVGSQLTLVADGALVTAVTGSNPVTDTTYPAAGRVGLRVGASTSTPQANGTGVQVSQLSAQTPVPVNTVRPTVSGSPIVGTVLTAGTGTWAPAATSYTYQWVRNGLPIDLATASTYTPVDTDTATTIRCDVTGINADGTGAPASSDSVTIVAAMTITDLQWLAGGPDGLGGPAGDAITDPHSIFDDVGADESAAGDVEYRLVYVRNAHLVQSATGAVVWIAPNTLSSDTSLAVGVATEPVNTNVATIPSEQDPPAGVVFSEPATSGAGVLVGTLAPGERKGLWLRRTVMVAAEASGEIDSAQVQLQVTVA